MSLGTLTIHHDYESGTTVEGTTRNSPAHLALKAHPSWTWSRHATGWLLRSSRHRPLKPYALDEITRVLTESGYTVERDIDETMPSVEQQETDREDRMNDRVHRLIERAGRQKTKADATRAKADAVFDSIPMGQPMLVDHHSYKADRNRRERAWNNLGKSIEQGAHAVELARRAETASHHMGARNNPVTVGNRIEELEAGRRRRQREVDGEPGWLTETDEHGQPHHDGASVIPPKNARTTYGARLPPSPSRSITGRTSTTSSRPKARPRAGPDVVAKGDWVLSSGMWMRVRRVNKKSVTVPNPVFPPPRSGEKENTWTIAWHKLRGHRTTEQMPPKFVEAYEAPGTDRISRTPRADDAR
ncbi:DUF3560 domain-containing protein [Amycolatopsis sp. w19]|uniref:DUF3560 domain-containing protein n=1 Tax=Amycolatopsis sp. w19 TaxID=3448134 RepID=UPI003F1BF5FC